ncbi:glycosyltransferase family 2 protein [Desulfoluna spongiiphila]|uniref:glycosyltransferase family 2 protein n=1 Tax=Desulfoluna spongiiphila TaxID=419481 RepID=UPI00125B5239|nr:glycosyltransferase family 2 protein [Desulfoluna spongiiphila]VVS90889.1 nucleotide-diphospho-sugar transferases [Desulfoluna spongiiphila]
MITCLVLPCYKTRAHILALLAKVGPEVNWIILVDDACPEGTGEYAISHISDSRLILVKHNKNKGVGAAVVSGFRKAIELDADCIVRIDSDGQMDPALIPRFLSPLNCGVADFAKGNRFWSPETLAGMPVTRLIGNAGLSFISKVSTGYWSLMDPNNGFFAIHAAVAQKLDLDKLESRYFFESDLLFRLNTIRAVGVDIPMYAVYEGETSNLSPLNSILEFFFKHIRNTTKRVVYNYFVRDFNVASLQMIIGMIFFWFGIIYGGFNWAYLSSQGMYASSGTVMLAALPVLLGFQLLLAALQQDINFEPKIPLHKLI